MVVDILDRWSIIASQNFNHLKPPFMLVNLKTALKIKKTEEPIRTSSLGF